VTLVLLPAQKFARLLYWYYEWQGIINEKLKYLPVAAFLQSFIKYLQFVQVRLGWADAHSDSIRTGKLFSDKVREVG